MKNINMESVNYGTRNAFNRYSQGKCHIIYNQGEILDEEAWKEIDACDFINVDSYKESTDINLIVWIEF